MCVIITFKDKLTPILSCKRGKDGTPFTTVSFIKAFDPGCFKGFIHYGEINHIKGELKPKFDTFLYCSFKKSNTYKIKFQWLFVFVVLLLFNNLVLS